MMKKDTNTMINLDVKSNLAKLLATENITIQHNNVKTASFDVKNRVLTLPIFKEKSGDVYDMLIAHECAHALWTPYEEWEGITDKELRSYVNVIEDTRIDKLIQAKYPGVVKNYMNGFDILEKQNFFGFSGKDINKDFMIIDKINLRSKSLNRLPFMFAPKDNEWLAKVDAVKTFDDVLTLAKEMLDWQKEQVEQMSKLPDFHVNAVIKNYDLNDDEDIFFATKLPCLFPLAAGVESPLVSLTLIFLPPESINKSPNDSGPEKSSPVNSPPRLRMSPLMS